MLQISEIRSAFEGFRFLLSKTSTRTSNHRFYKNVKMRGQIWAKSYQVQKSRIFGYQHCYKKYEINTYGNSICWVFVQKVFHFVFIPQHISSHLPQHTDQPKKKALLSRSLCEKILKRELSRRKYCEISRKFAQTFFFTEFLLRENSESFKKMLTV